MNIKDKVKIIEAIAKGSVDDIEVIDTKSELVIESEDMEAVEVIIAKPVTKIDVNAA